MSFVIPNATDTTSGNRFAALDQAEPDALDFEILGNRANGVLSGCEVTPLATPGSAVNVASGYVLIGGKSYPVAAYNNFVLPSSPSNNRFDLIVGRLSGSTVSITCVSGTESVSNPSFPRSSARIKVSSLAGLQATTYINLATDVILAAVYRSGAVAITEERIVDKRVSVKGGVSYQGTGTPDPALGEDASLYFKTSLGATDSSGVYVKRSGAWTELGTATVDPGVPVGAMIMWPSPNTAPASASWLEASGAAVSRTTYSALFSVIGTTYGAGDGSTTFNLPDFRGQYLCGRTDSGTMGAQVGNAGSTVTLTTGNLPSHTHGLTGATADLNGGHSHTINHTHGSATTASSAAPHTHQVTGNVEQNYISSPAFNPDTEEANQQFGWVYTYKAGNSAIVPFQSHAHNHAINITSQSSDAPHSHTVPITPFSGSSSTIEGHVHQLSGNTQATGSATPVNVMPSTYYIRYFIRYA